jgi:GNAT superfamily N-acetyltransferase
MLIRPLDIVADFAAVTDLHVRAQDFWTLTDTPIDPAAAKPHFDPVLKATEFFTEAPPGGDPATSVRLGQYCNSTLVGIAELAFNYPEPQDAYLGLMLLDPQMRGQGLGPQLLAQVENLARNAHAPILYLAVLQANPRGRAFWERMGFAATGKTGLDADTGHILHRLMKPLVA